MELIVLEKKRRSRSLFKAYSARPHGPLACARIYQTDVRASSDLSETGSSFLLRLEARCAPVTQWHGPSSRG
ncbi:hypothetical protein J6590_015747 [Homalodisca vitripennis]|nr:hypothetical protein J6590_015747 [Homalodisca vitripennis]